jgi:hypothetical protein
MQQITKEAAQFFLDNQNRLYDMPVAENIDEAMEFLEDCMAMVFEDLKELKAYWKEEGVDMMELTDQEILESLEVFKMPDDRILLVEA